MKTVNIHEAKTHFSRIVDEVAGGTEILIAKAGRAVAKLVPIREPKTIRFGVLKGKVTIAEDFDAPLPDDVLATFEGRS